jgi:hypothetical protein
MSQLSHMYVAPSGQQTLTRKATKHMPIMVHRRFHPGFSCTLLLLPTELLPGSASAPSASMAASPPSSPRVTKCARGATTSCRWRLAGRERAFRPCKHIINGYARGHEKQRFVCSEIQVSMQCGSPVSEAAAGAPWAMAAPPAALGVVMGPHGAPQVCKLRISAKFQRACVQRYSPYLALLPTYYCCATHDGSQSCSHRPGRPASRTSRCTATNSPSQCKQLAVVFGDGV